MLAFSIMFFSVALLCLMLGWADGIRHNRAYLHLPASGAWMVATAILAGLGVVLLVLSRAGKKS